MGDTSAHITSVYESSSSIHPPTEVSFSNLDLLTEDVVNEVEAKGDDLPDDEGSYSSISSAASIKMDTESLKSSKEREKKESPLRKELSLRKEAELLTDDGKMNTASMTRREARRARMTSPLVMNGVQPAVQESGASVQADLQIEAAPTDEAPPPLVASRSMDPAVNTAIWLDEDEPGKIVPHSEEEPGRIRICASFDGGASDPITPSCRDATTDESGALEIPNKLGIWDSEDKNKTETKIVSMVSQVHMDRKPAKHNPVSHSVKDMAPEARDEKSLHLPLSQAVAYRRADNGGLQLTDSSARILPNLTTKAQFRSGESSEPGNIGKTLELDEPGQIIVNSKIEDEPGIIPKTRICGVVTHKGGLTDGPARSSPRTRKTGSKGLSLSISEGHTMNSARSSYVTSTDHHRVSSTGDVPALRGPLGSTGDRSARNGSLRGVRSFDQERNEDSPVGCTSNSKMGQWSPPRPISPFEPGKSRRSTGRENTQTRFVSRPSATSGSTSLNQKSSWNHEEEKILSPPPTTSTTDTEPIDEIKRRGRRFDDSISHESYMDTGTSEVTEKAGNLCVVPAYNDEVYKADSFASVHEEKKLDTGSSNDFESTKKTESTESESLLFSNEAFAVVQAGAEVLTSVSDFFMGVAPDTPKSQRPQKKKSPRKSPQLADRIPSSKGKVTSPERGRDLAAASPNLLVGHEKSLTESLVQSAHIYSIGAACPGSGWGEDGDVNAYVLDQVLPPIRVSSPSMDGIRKKGRKKATLDSTAVQSLDKAAAEIDSSPVASGGWWLEEELARRARLRMTSEQKTTVADRIDELNAKRASIAEAGTRPTFSSHQETTVLSASAMTVTERIQALNEARDGTLVSPVEKQWLSPSSRADKPFSFLGKVTNVELSDDAIEENTTVDISRSSCMRPVTNRQESDADFGEGGGDKGEVTCAANDFIESDIIGSDETNTADLADTVPKVSQTEHGQNFFRDADENGETSPRPYQNCGVESSINSVAAEMTVGADEPDENCPEELLCSRSQDEDTDHFCVVDSVAQDNDAGAVSCEALCTESSDMETKKTRNKDREDENLETAEMLESDEMLGQDIDDSVPSGGKWSDEESKTGDIGNGSESQFAHSVINNTTPDEGNASLQPNESGDFEGSVDQSSVSDGRDKTLNLQLSEPPELQRINVHVASVGLEVRARTPLGTTEGNVSSDSPDLVTTDTRCQSPVSESDESTSESFTKEESDDVALAVDKCPPPALDPVAAGESASTTSMYSSAASDVAVPPGLVEDKTTVVSDAAIFPSVRSDPESEEKFVLLPMINHDIGIPKGDCMLSLLAESPDMSFLDRVNQCVWRCRTMRQNCNTQWVREEFQRKKDSPPRGRSSIPIDVDEARVVGGLETVGRTQKAALEHLKYNEIDDALLLFEDILSSYNRYRSTNPVAAAAVVVEENLGVVLHNIGLVHLLRGALDDAHDCFDAATVNRASTLGVDHHDYVCSLAKRALCRYGLDDFEKARHDYHECFERSKGRISTIADYRQLAEITNNLGCLSYKFGDLERTAYLFQEALRLQQIAKKQSLYAGSRFSTQSLTTNSSIVEANLGFLALSTKEYERSILLLEEALGKQELLLWGADTTLIATLDHLAVANYVSGEAGKSMALQLLRRILNIQADAFGLDDPRTLATGGKIRMLESTENAVVVTDAAVPAKAQNGKTTKPLLTKMFKARKKKKSTTRFDNFH